MEEEAEAKRCKRLVDESVSVVVRVVKIRVEVAKGVDRGREVEAMVQMVAMQEVGTECRNVAVV